MLIISDVAKAVFPNPDNFIFFALHDLVELFPDNRLQKLFHMIAAFDQIRHIENTE